MASVVTKQWVGTKRKEIYTPSLPNKRYEVIYIDPPWTYNDKASAGNRGSSFKYATMTLDQIKELPIHNIAEDNCALFMWVTWPFVFEAEKVVESWNEGQDSTFIYKTCAFTWVKRNKNFRKNFKKYLNSLRKGNTTITSIINLITTKYHWGMGHYTRSNSEFVLLFLKGNLKRKSAGVHQIIDYPVGDHSAKPPVVKDKIVELYGDLPRIELFARETTEGWDSWGLEV